MNKGSAILLALLAPWWVGDAMASATLDAQAGHWTDLYSDSSNVDFAQSDDVTHDPLSQAMVLVSGAPSGFFTSTLISPPSSGGWGRVYLDARFQRASDIQATFVGANGVDYPLALTPSGAAGFNLEASLSPVPADVDGRLRVAFTRSGVVAPSLLGARLTWTPRSVVELALDSAAAACSGSNLNVRLRASVSFADTDLVLVAPLPDAGPMAAPQEGRLRFIAASRGGSYHPAGAPPLVIRGVTVPPHSVFWDLPGQTAGSTFVVSFDVALPVGLLNTTPFALSASAHWGAGELATATRALSTISASALSLSKVASNVYPILGTDHATAGSSIGYRLVVQNTSPRLCGEDAHQLVVWDDVSELFSHPGLNGPVIETPPGITEILGGGLYTEDGTVVGGVTIPPRSVYWQLDELPVGQRVTLGFSVELEEGLPADLEIDNCGETRSSLKPTLVATGCHELTVGLPVDPVPVFAKGDTLRGRTSISANEDNPGITVGFGELIGFSLSAVNGGATVLNQVRFYDKVPANTTFVAAWPAASAETVVLYHTGGANRDVDDPPDILPNGDFDLGAGKWSTTPPANSALVTWVGAMEPAISSSIFPDGDLPLTSQVDLLLRVATPADLCSPFVIENTGILQVFAMTQLGDTVAVPLDPAPRAQNVELVEVTPRTAEVSALALSASPSTLVGTGTLRYELGFTNQQPGGAPTGPASLATVDVNLPQVSINGTLTPLSLAGVVAPGATLDFSGLPTSFRVTWTQVPAGARRTALIDIEVPRGVLDGARPTLTANVRLTDPNCGPRTAQASAAATVRVEPRLVVQKAVDFSVAGPGGELEYTLTAVNVGEGAATGVVVSDRIPAGTTFGSASPLPGGEIWFSASPPPILPAAIAPNNSFSAAFVRSSGLFAPGTESGGRILSPYGGATTWVVFLADDDRLTPPQLAAGPSRELRFKVVIDEDTVNGHVVSNRSAIESAELLTAVGNTVQTTISQRPSLVVSRVCPSVVRAGETFTYQVHYRNDSTNDDTTVLLSDTLPSGLSYQTDAHAWNAPAFARYGATPVPGTFTAPTLSWRVTDAISGPLLPGEGGTFTVTVTTSATASTGTLFDIGGIGTATNIGGTFTVSSSCIVRVANPDLTTRIVVDQPSPISGDTLNYTVSVQNGGLNSATNSVLTIELPVGVTYSPGSVRVTTPGWSVSAPVITTDPVTGGQRLTFAAANTSTLVGPSAIAGLLPANQQPILLTFAATTSGLSPDLTLTACSDIATPDIEEPVLPNRGCVSATVPRPDPYVSKTGPASVQPGERMAWTLTWGNDSRQPGGRVAFIDALPDGPAPPADGVPDVRFLTASGNAGEAFWYHDGDRLAPTPALDPNNPAATGWASNPAALAGPVSYVAFVVEVGSAAGPHEVYIEAELVDPVTGLLPDAGARLENCAAITGVSLDGDLSDNADCVLSAVPGLDLALDLSCTPEGARPGLRPGEEGSYQAVVTNSGTSTVYGVRFATTFPLLELSDDAGLVTASLVDSNGSVRTTPVTWTSNQGTFYLGSTNPASPDYYRRVGLRPNESVSVSFEGRVSLDALSGSALVASAVAGSDYSVGWQPGDPIEEILTNNADTCGTTVWRPDPTLTKRATSGGETLVSAAPSTRVTYELSYDNIGEASADEVVVEDLLPEGLGFVVGSLSGLPPSATVDYTDGTTWGVTPSGSAGTVDDSIRGFRVQWAGALTAPPEGFTSLSEPAQFASGTFTGTVAGGAGVTLSADFPHVPSYVTPALPEVGVATSWSYVIVTPTSGAPAGDRLLVDVLDAQTDALVEGFADLLPDASGAVALSDLDAGTHPRIKLRIKWTTDRAPTCGAWDTAVRRLGTTAILSSAAGGTVLGNDQFSGDRAWTSSALHPSGLVRLDVDGQGTKVASPNGRFFVLGSPPALWELVGGQPVLRRTVAALSNTARVSDEGVIADLAAGRVYGPSANGWVEVVTPIVAGPVERATFISPLSFLSYEFGNANWMLGPVRTGRVKRWVWSPETGTLSSTLVHEVAEDLQNQSLSGAFQVAGDFVLFALGGSMSGVEVNANRGTKYLLVLRRTPALTAVFQYAIPASIQGRLPRITTLGHVYWHSLVSGSAQAQALLRTAAGSYQRVGFGADVPFPGNSHYFEVAQNGTVMYPDTSGQNAIWRPIEQNGVMSMVQVTAAQLGLTPGTFTVNGLSRDGLVAARITSNGSYRVLTPNLDSGWTYTVETVTGAVSSLIVGSSYLDGLFRFNAFPPAVGVIHREGGTWRTATASVWDLTAWRTSFDADLNMVTGRFDNGFLLNNNHVWTQCTGGTNLALDRIDVVLRGAAPPAITYQAELGSVCTGDLINRAFVSTSTPEISQANNQASAQLAVERSDLAVTLSSSAVVLEEGDPLVLTAVVTNRGPNGASSATLTLTTPFGPPHVVTVPPLASGASWTTTLARTASGLVPNTTSFASASVTSGLLDCGADNDFAAVTLFAGELPNPWVLVDGPTALTAGANLPVKLTYGNNGNVAVPATVSFALPSGTTLVSSSVPATVSGQTLSWSVGVLAPGALQTIDLVLSTTPCEAGSLLSTATIATDPAGAAQLSESDDFDSLVTTLQPAASSLSIEAIAHRQSAAPGETIHFTAFVTNLGSDPSSGLITVTVPPGLAVAPASLGGASVAGNTLSFGPIDLPAGGTRSILFGLLVTGESGALTPTFTASGTCGASVTTTTTTLVTGPGLHIAKSGDRLMACGAEETRWTILVTNTGTSPIAPRVVSDIVPTGLTYRAASIRGPGANDSAAPNLSWSLPELAPGNSFTLEYATTGPDLAGVLTNAVDPAAAAPLLGECSPTSPGNPGGGELAVVQSANSACLTPGGLVEVTLEVANGPTTRTGVTAFGLLPAGLELVASDDGQVIDGVLTFALGELAPQGRRTLRYTVRVAPTAASGALFSIGAMVRASNLFVAANTLDLAPLVCGAPVGCIGSVCLPSTGCTAIPLDDDEPCTLDGCIVGSTCQGGVCQGGQPRSCDDDNACTDDACVDGACENTNNTDVCDDADACTTVDVCEAGSCVGSAPLACDDGNECTSDRCDPVLGCVAEFAPGPCNTGELCGASECIEGIGGNPPTCEVVQEPGCTAEEPVMVYGVVTDTRGVAVGSVRCTLLAGQSLTCVTEDDDPTRVKVFNDLWCGQ